jgi:hypothetical protein
LFLSGGFDAFSCRNAFQRLSFLHRFSQRLPKIAQRLFSYFPESPKKMRLAVLRKTLNLKTDFQNVFSWAVV